MRAVISARIAKNILEDAISALNIEKPDKGLEKEYRYFDTKYYTVENVVGMSVEEAKDKLKNFTIEYSGTGSKVIATSPKAGKRVAEGSTIRVMLDD